MKKIYLAGPDVFLPNAIEEGGAAKSLMPRLWIRGTLSNG
jgi:nucleoside 2-deoxyribosyltransferase